MTDHPPDPTRDDRRRTGGRRGIIDFPGFDKTDRHIDHIRPIKKFPNLLNDSEQRKICFNYNNLQYLPKTENLKKHDKYNPSDFENAWIADNGYTWRLCDDKRYKLTNLGY
jgi:hypothetical protein